ncbi:MAG: alpha/beta hydrolase [Planctomycetota bacterium]
MKKEVVYKTAGRIKLKLHIFEPEGRNPDAALPAIVFFFGGGWNGGTPSQFSEQCKYLAARGMVAISAEYRTKKRGGVTPFECVKDGKSAIRYVRSHAKELGVDPGKLAGGGGSAGGHVAAATGTVPALEEEGEDLAVSSRPDALVLFNPVYDNGPGGYGHNRVGRRYREISPIHNITEDAPPTIVFFGSKDPLVPVGTSEKYKALMEKHGRRCDLHIYEGEGHGFFNFGRKGKKRGAPSPFDVTMAETEKFLRSLGYIEGGEADEGKGPAPAGSRRPR